MYVAACLKQDYDNFAISRKYKTLACAWCFTHAIVTKGGGGEGRGLMFNFLLKTHTG